MYEDNKLSIAAVLAAWLMGTTFSQAANLQLRHDETDNTIAVYRDDATKPVVTQHAPPDFRPYIHPIVAPDGVGELTEMQPPHHPHQTGLYWGLTNVNGRDYFHNPGGDHWRRVSATMLQANEGGQQDYVQWQSVYDLLDPDGEVLLTETQIWTMRERDDEYVLELQWIGQAKTDVTVGKHDYGGLFLRMPWRSGIKAEVVNAARQRDQKTEGQRAPWLDIGIEVNGRKDLAHVAIFDHPNNPRFPTPWRVDDQFGVGPAPTQLGDWKLAKDEEVVVRYQLRVSTKPLRDVEVTDHWREFSGEDYAFALWWLAQQEGRQAEFLNPERAIAAMQVPDDFEVNAWASEPMITQPMAFCWDDRGRLWVAENRDYENRGGGFANSGDSRILILEDTDRDGTADRRKVFLEGIPFPAAIAVGFDGLWLGAPPNLLFVPDRDADDRADFDDIEVHLTGWGIRDRHETINSLHWGPDGWLYGCQGFATPSRVGKPANPKFGYEHHRNFPREFEYDGPTVELDGGVWRYHPTKQQFEVVAHGFSNPWGIDYDAKGQLFITACVIPHLWHVIPGGIYHRQGGQHLNPYFYQDIQTIADHSHRSAHGGARIYLSDAFPQRYHGQIFMANIHEHAVLADVLEPRGSGFIGSHGEDFLLANNAQWIGFGIEIGPDGAVYVLDWHDADICGNEVVYKDTGRIFRISPKQSAANQWEGRYSDLKNLSDLDLANLQKSTSAWHARRARVILQGRAEKGEVGSAAVEALRQVYNAHDQADHRLRAMWALHLIDELPVETLVGALDDRDEHVRAWAIQILCEDKSPPSRALTRFADLARSDTSPVVRLYLAAALQRIGWDARWPIAMALVTHDEDAEDHNIPKMIWFGVEPLVPEHPSLAIELAAQSRIPLVTRSIARRMADAELLEPLLQAIRETPDVRRELLLGMHNSLAGRVDVQPPPNWKSVYDVLQSDGDDSGRIAREIAQQFDSTHAAKEMLASLRSNGESVDGRRNAIRGLAGREHPELRALLVDLLDDAELRRDAIRAMAAYDDARLTRRLLARYGRLTPEEKLEAVYTMASRQRSGELLTQAIAREEVPKQDIPAYVARLMRRVVGPEFVDVWGPIDERSADQESNFAKYRELVTAQAVSDANQSRGHEVFRKTCMTCHTLHGEGREIGPDITGANRTNIEYLLGNILTPSAVIQDAYRMHLVVTDDGRVFSGVPASETEHQVLLRVAGQDEPAAIAKSAIESREIAPVSMMPDGLLNELSDSEVLDLFAYLMLSR